MIEPILGHVGVMSLNRKLQRLEQHKLVQEAEAELAAGLHEQVRVGEGRGGRGGKGEVKGG